MHTKLEWLQLFASNFNKTRYNQIMQNQSDKIGSTKYEGKFPAKESDYLIPVFPPRHPFHDAIVWDKTTSQYYNKKTDIYLSEDDVTFHNLPPQFGGLPDIVMGPSNSIDIYGPLVNKNDAKIVIQVEHTADTFSVCFDDFVLFNAYMDSNKEWHIVFPAHCRTEPLDDN